MSGGRLVHGAMHPEIGHMRIPHDEKTFNGCCPFHESCLEGLASGTAIEKRCGIRGEHLPADHPVWELEAGYLAFAVTNVALTLSPRRVVMGGSVMRNPKLLPQIRKEVKTLLHGYLKHLSTEEAIAEFIVPPLLGDDCGILGALILAESSLPTYPSYNK